MGMAPEKTFAPGRDVRFAFLIEPPFGYRTTTGAVTGCDAELARHVLRAIGAGALIPIETDFAELIPGLADGRWDMTTGLFVTEERRQVVDFSRPIWALPDGLLVAAGNPHGIAGYASIARAAALRLGVVRDQVQHATALRLGVTPSQIQIFGTYAEAAAAVAAGTIDAQASAAMAHRGYLAENPALALTAVEVPADEKRAEQGAFAFAKSQAVLRDAVDSVLAGFLGSAEYHALVGRFGL
jgi:polar amino acid transport system substrate-binding protein